MVEVNIFQVHVTQHETGPDVNPGRAVKLPLDDHNQHAFVSPESGSTEANVKAIHPFAAAQSP